MVKLNFLSHEIREQRYKNKKRLTEIFLFIFFALDFIISYRFIYLTNRLNTAYNISSKNNKIAATALSTAKSKDLIDNLDYINGVLSNKINFEKLTLSNDSINIKCNIQSKEEFISIIKYLEEKKNIRINSIVPPYEEEGSLKFEVGLVEKK